MERFSAVLAVLLLSMLPVASPRVLGAGEGSRVLYLGDSLSIEAFGQTLDSSMRSCGFEVHTVVAGGASPYYWLKSYQSLPCSIGFWEKTGSAERRVAYVRAVPKLEDLMAQAKPDVVVVQTGINLYATLRSKRRPKEENVATVGSLIDQMCRAIGEGGAISYWILPPHSHENRYSLDLQEELAGIMRGVVRGYGGAVFESGQVTRFVDPYPATDGIHYGPAEARGWAEKVSAHFADYMRVKPTGAPALPVLAVREASSPAAARASVPPAAPSDEGGPGFPEEVALRIRLEEKSELRDAARLDYANALGLYEYTVVKDLRGNYPLERIRIAQGVVFGRRLTGAAKAEIGSETELVLVPLSRYKNLESWQMFDDLRPNFEIPIYTPKLD